ncbi:MAG: translation initiation factor [Chitinophagales bacterium]|nr:translation initiation factor [Chitinophagales bacterium]MDW8428790.1 translation initiation factor [Chitinophagales bacterium]
MGKNSSRVLVYSTSASATDQQNSKQQHRLWLRTERKGRGGKTVTIIGGFTIPADAIHELARRLKSACGIGGSVVDNEIVLQGQVREKAAALLRQWNYPVH